MRQKRSTRDNYGGLDDFRLVAAFLVAAIHTSPLASFNGEADFFLTRVLARAAVPFFFMVTGQFVAGRFLSGNDAVSGVGRRCAAETAPWHWMKKILLLYLCGILLYLPIGIYAGHYTGLTVGAALRMFFFDGTFYHLWYFPACMEGVLILWLLSRFLRLRGILIVSVVFYLAGLAGDSYYGLVQKFPVPDSVYQFIFQFSSYTRNGLFFAPLFLVLGTWMGQEGRPERIREYGQKNLIGLLVSILLMTAEAFCLRFFELPRHDSMYLMLVPTTVSLYRCLLCFKGSSRKLFRSAALWIYILHPAFIVAVRGAAKVLKATPLLVDNSLIHYLAVIVLSAGAGFGVALAERRIFHSAASRTQECRADGRAWIELDREALAQNVSFLRSLLPETCRLMPAVKANAYGHGDALIAGELNRLGVEAFCVACAGEGVTLRRAGIKGEILILGCTMRSELPLLVRYRLTQAVTDYSYAELLAQSGLKLSVHLAVDTGMHRLGIRCENMEEILAVFQMKNLTVKGMFTHLSACESLTEESRDFTESQIRAFYGVLEGLAEQGIPCPKLHLQASYGILNYSGLDADYARPGILLYGVHSTMENRLFSQEQPAPVLSLKARVVSVRTLYPGDSAGYGLAFTAEKDMRIAVLSIGYADGLPRILSCGRGGVLIHGCKAPIIGKICMDQTLVDISGIPRTKPGDTAVLIGRSGELEITAEEVAEACGTITNELLSRLGSRLERFWADL